MSQSSSQSSVNNNAQSSVINGDTIFTGKIFKVIRKTITGRSGKKLERHIIVHPGAVAILPILNDGRIVLIRQYRTAVDETLIEIPTGTLEPGERPVSTALRELIEETGYAAKTLTPVMTFYTSPGFIKEEMHLFKATGLTAGQTNMEDGEKIEPLLVTLDEAMELIAKGEIHDSKTLTALLWYKNQKINGG